MTRQTVEVLAKLEGRCLYITENVVGCCCCIDNFPQHVCGRSDVKEVLIDGYVIAWWCEEHIKEKHPYSVEQLDENPNSV